MVSEAWVEKREIGPCTLYLGDCLAMLAAGEIPVEAAIVTDPPYGIGFTHGGGGAGYRKMMPTMIDRGPAGSSIIGDDVAFDPGPWLAFAATGERRRKNAKGTLRMALCGADHYATRLPEGKGAWYTWDKSCGGGPADSFTDSEIIWMGARNARRIYRHQWKGRLRAGNSERRYHVSEKPVGLMAWMIETVRTPVGSLVCDPYMGSGSTGLACLQTGRRFLGIEIDPAHYATACARIERAWAASNPTP